ncbi:MAG TPA: hypothetical protein VN285_01880 [Candidatus Deferrimicrobium sp.]|nr:hypothetical protein [Candidatus Deferrimicrobium sp.]
MSQKRFLVVRVALFSALVYVLSWGTQYLPNVNFIFFVVFSAGVIWGAAAGSLVGLFGMGLWTTFNPYGPAPVPIILAQVAGAAGGGLVGGVFHRGRWQRYSPVALTLRLILAAVCCTVIFYLPVNVIDAALFQPFWPRFIGGALWAAISLGFNVLIFPLLFNVTRRLYHRENAPA